MKIIPALVAALVLSACGSSGLSSRAATVNYGIAIAQTDCQALARRHVDPTLLKPLTARYKFGRCMTDTLAPKPTLGLPMQSGYAMAFAVAGQDELDSYSRYRNYEILIVDGQVMRRIRQNFETGIWETF